MAVRVTFCDRAGMGERVVIVHDYLTQRGGAERVVLAMLRAFPQARLVTSLYDADATYPEFRDFDVETMWPNRLPMLRHDPRRALPMLAKAFSSTVIRDADFVLCSSSGWAHGVQTAAPKIVYCHNPPRWLHQTRDYLADQAVPVRLALEVLRRPLTRWDRQAAATATAYLANSTIVADRIRASYGIEADVVPPPIMIDPDGPQQPVAGLEPGFLLTISRARGYKNASTVCAAVERTDERLVVVGGLPDRADGPHWSPRLVGATGVSDAQLRWLYANCAGLVAMSHEDFGLTPLEANAFGRPVICLRAGGYLDTMRPGKTGVWVEDLTVDALLAAIEDFRLTPWSPTAIRAHAERFSPATFASRLRAIAADVTAVVPPQRTGGHDRLAV